LKHCGWPARFLAPEQVGDQSSRILANSTYDYLYKRFTFFSIVKISACFNVRQW
jgi:hypothetical protein